MNSKQPEHKKLAFDCPNCGVFSKQIWSTSITIYCTVVNPNGGKNGTQYEVKEISTSRCEHCDQHSIWLNSKMIFPIEGGIEKPNEDMPIEVKEDYLEAKMIVNLSPRGAAALLRLALQKLCISFGEKGKNINDDIKNLVKKGLPEAIQQALDSVRVIGNNAVHPGQIDLKDDYDTAYKMFGFLNVICDILITQPKKIKEFYEYKIPENLRQEIAKRDGAV